MEFSSRKPEDPGEKKEEGIEVLEIIQVEDPNKPPKVLVRCELVDGKVRLEGDEDLIKELRKEKFYWDGKEVTPEDGEKFLRAVKASYRNPYFLARRIK